MRTFDVHKNSGKELVLAKRRLNYKVISIVSLILVIIDSLNYGLERFAFSREIYTLVYVVSYFAYILIVSLLFKAYYWVTYPSILTIGDSSIKLRAVLFTYTIETKEFIVDTVSNEIIHLFKPGNLRQIILNYGMGKLVAVINEDELTKLVD